MKTINFLFFSISLGLACFTLIASAQGEPGTAAAELKRLDYSIDADGFGGAARKTDDTNVLQLFLTTGIDVNAQSTTNKITALMFAAQQGHIDAVNFLIENGADVNAKDIQGLTALMFAAHSGNASIAETLIKHGAKVNETDGFGWTPLIRAAEKGMYEMVKALLANQADPNLRDGKGRTALDFAQKKGFQNVVELLKSYTTVGAAEIEGAFGLKLGDIFDATNANAVLAAQQEQNAGLEYNFVPQKTLPPFENYSVFITPKTHRIYLISADYSFELENRNAEQDSQLNVVIAALSNKYGKPDTGGWGFNLYNMERNGKAIRIVRSGGGQANQFKVTLIYGDQSLEQLSNSETAEIIQAKKDAEQTDMQKKAKALDASGL